MSKKLLIPVSTILFLFSGCSEVPPEADYKRPEHIFATPVDSNKILSIDTGDPNSYRFAADQFVIKIEDNYTIDEAGVQAADVANSIEGEIIGRIPEGRIYQIRVNTTTQTHLDEKISQANIHPAVETAVYNFIFSPRSDTYSPEYCLHEDDNHLLEPTMRCAMDAIKYSELVPIMGKINELMTLSPVKVAVIDTGLNLQSGQFDNVKIVNLENPALPPMEQDSTGHGTKVAGIIASDNRDGSMNGIASRMLGNKLTLYVGDGVSKGFMTILTQIFLAGLHARVNVINMSFGIGGENPPPQVMNLRFLFEYTMKAMPNVLFVGAAGNYPYELKLNNDVPAGIQLPNMITVGGTALCDPEIAWPSSSWGPLIDMAAPAESVPTIDAFTPGADVEPDSGNSYATPMAVSGAAILKSLNPSLAPEQLKNYIKEYTLPTDLSIGGRRFVLPVSIIQALIDSNPPQSILDYIDADDYPGEWDNPGLIAHRICGGVHIHVEHYGSYMFKPEDDEAMGFINEMGWGLMVAPEDEFSFSMGGEGPFFTGYEYQVPAEAEVSIGTAKDGEFDWGGAAISGRINVKKCTITQRLFEEPIYLEMEAELEGVLEITDPPALDPFYKPVYGLFKVPMTVMGNDDINSYLEANCVAGRNYTEPP